MDSLRCSHRRWWIIRSTLCKTPSGRFFVIWTGHLFPRRGSNRVLLQAPSPTCSRYDTPPTSRLRALKRKPLAMGTRAPRVPSIVDWFCQLPSLVSVADSVVLEDCHRARGNARAPLAGIGEDATSVIIGAPPLQVGQQLWSLLRVAQVRRANAAIPWRMVKFTRSINDVFNRPEKPHCCKVT